MRGVFVLSLGALVLAGCRTQDFPTYPANYREYAYVTNGGSGTVTVLDVVNVRVDRELPVGENPVAVAASPALNEVYVVNQGATNRAGRARYRDRQRKEPGGGDDSAAPAAGVDGH